MSSFTVYFKKYPENLITFYFYLSTCFQEYFYFHFGNRIPKNFYWYFYSSMQAGYFVQHYDNVKVNEHMPNIYVKVDTV